MKCSLTWLLAKPSRILFGSFIALPIANGMATLAAGPDEATKPLAPPSLVFEERDGIVAFEAEHFFEQTSNDVRAWYLTTKEKSPSIEPDGDRSHIGGASGGAYLELLPDTRRTHDDKLIKGQNFINEAGKMAILSYKVHFSTPGTYWLWARAFTTTPEDNGLHFGIDGTWPATAQRWQTVTRDRWHWESKQRTEEVHVGVPGILTLDVKEAGQHTIHVSMREDGIELDRILLANRHDYRPEGLGPTSIAKVGQLPKAFPYVESETPADDTTTKSLAAKQTNAQEKTDPSPSRAQGPPLVQPRQPDGKGTVSLSGEMRQWHKVTLTLDGPFAHEHDNVPNPFTDMNLTVTFTHESGSPKYVVPGYFAADGNAAETGAKNGTQWRAHLSPDKTGKWNYQVAFTNGPQAAIGGKGAPVAGLDGKSGSFEIADSNKQSPDFRSKGRLQYVGGHYLRHVGTGEYFLKIGPDSPETLLAYEDFDDTVAPKKNAPLKSWQPHVKDWKSGDPTWRNGKGKGLIGAMNYLASEGCNTISFLPYNAGGDGDSVWPFVQREDKLHYDCSKLDQWGIAMSHATNVGLHLHFKLQENESDDNRRGDKLEAVNVPESLDGGKLGIERKLYCRELIARFSHELGINWNIGEENTQSSEEQIDMIRYLNETDPYKHNIVIHTFPNQQDKIYPALLGNKSLLTGASLQNSWSAAHQKTLKWLNESDKAGRPWVVCNDEQNPASDGVPADPGYEGKDGFAVQNGKQYNLHDVRKLCLWGTFMAGGGGVEYYFGYKHPQNDLVCQDFRSRDQSWDYGRFAVNFFRDQKIPFWEMSSADSLVGNAENTNSRYCFAKKGELYLVYLPTGGSSQLDLADTQRKFTVSWFNPRTGGSLADGSVKSVDGGREVSLGDPPSDRDQDWLVMVR